MTGLARSAWSARFLLFAPAALVVAPDLLAQDVARATGMRFGPVPLGRLVGAGLALLLVVAVQRRWSIRPAVATAASAVATLTLLAVALSASPPGLAPLVGGATFTLVVAMGAGLLADATDGDRHVAGLVHLVVGGLLGVGAVPVLASVVASAGGTVRATFLLLAALAAAATLAARWPGADGSPGDVDALRSLVRRRLGHDDDAPEPERPPRGGELRRVWTTASVRAVAPVALGAGSVLTSVPKVTELLLRERWITPVDSRRFGVGVTVAIGAIVVVLAARRIASAGQHGPARLGHLVAWAATTGGVAVALAGAAPSPVLGLLAVALGTGAVAIALAGSLVLVGRTVDAPHRTHAAAVLATAALGGGLVGDLAASSLGSRFGVGWCAVAVGAVLVFGAGRLSRSLADLDLDASAATTRIVEAEELRVQRTEGRSLPLLSCRHIDFSYGQLQVLFDVSFSIDDGEMVALLGTNGAGKSTLLRVISGLGSPSRGSVHLAGTEITHAPTDARVAMGITQIPGGKAVFGPLTVAENLRAYSYSCGRDRATIERGIEATFAAFPRLAERRNQSAATLSGGEQQMLALGKALILRPRLLLIDELSLGLAPIVVGELLAMVQRINDEGTAIVLVEQSVNVALSLVDRAYFMEKGQVRFEGDAAELADRPDLLRTVFLAGAGAG